MPSTMYEDRVRRHTQRQDNARIDAKIRANVERYSDRPLDELNQRLIHLDREWDVERVLESYSATMSLAGLALGSLVNRRWLVLPALAGGFMLQHTLQGWCPPVAAIRRLGVRTRREIDEEKYALKALRGDFSGLENPLPHDAQVQAALNASRVQSPHERSF